jgi:pimeloyl-ACP methyl ester carboxylesterase
MTPTTLQATSAFYEKNPLTRVLRWSLKSIEQLSPHLAMRAAARLFITPLPHKWTQRKKIWDHHWKRESWQFENASLTIYASQTGDVGQSTAIEIQKPSVLLVHGWGGHAAQMLPLAKELQEQGMQVFLIDMPAHGRSKGSQSSLPQFARALKFVTSRLTSEGNPLRALVAHSLAASAAAYAVSRGLETERLILIAPPASPHEFTRLFAKVFNIKESTRAAMQNHIELTEGVLMQHFEPSDVGMLIKQAVLIVHDTNDSINPFNDGLAFQAAIAGAKLLRTQGLGHRKILKAQSVLQDIASFITTK